MSATDLPPGAARVVRPTRYFIALSVAYSRLSQGGGR